MQKQNPGVHCWESQVQIIAEHHCAFYFEELEHLYINTCLFQGL